MIKKLNLPEIIRNINSSVKTTTEKVVVSSDDKKKEKTSTLREPRLSKLAGKKRLTQKNKNERIDTKKRFFDLVENIEQEPEKANKINKPSKEDKKDFSAIAKGKKLIIVPEENYGRPLRELISHDTPIVDVPFVADNVRGNMGSYWNFDDELEQMINLTDHQEVSDNSSHTVIHDEAHDTNRVTDFGETEEWGALKAKQKKFNNSNKVYSEDLWRTYSRGGMFSGTTEKEGKIEKEIEPTINTSKEFIDYVHELNLPFSREEIDKLNISYGNLIADVEPEYNFYIKSYENKLKDTSVHENTLPDMYLLIANEEKKNKNPIIDKIASLENKITVPKEVFKSATKQTQVKKTAVKGFFEDFSRKYDDIKDISRFNNKVSNVVISCNDIDTITEFNNKKEMFPMYSDISFSTERTTVFSQILKETNLSNAFTSQIVNSIIDNKFKTLPCRQTIEKISQGSKRENVRKETKLEQLNKKYWDVTDILLNISEKDTKPNEEKVLFFGSIDNERTASTSKEYDFAKSLYMTIFSSKIQAFIKQNLRTYEEILKGKKAYSETVLYRIAKYENEKNGKLIKNYYIPNSNELDIVNIVDAQVKYDKKYTYVIYAYQLVLGNKYRYTDVEADRYTQHTAFKTIQEPSLIVMEHEYAVFSAKILDDLPMAPDVNIIPYKDVDNRLLLNMNSNSGDRMMKPIVVKPEDAILFKNIREARNKKEEDMLRYKSDDHIIAYEIYRLDKHPESYADFAQHMRKIVSTDVNLQTIQNATSAAYRDVLIPNKTYFYMFRAYDVHGNISNPSPVYKVRLINEDGLVLLDKSIVEFKQEQKTTTKKAKRYLQIVPNVLQSLIDEEKSGYDDASTASELGNKIHLGTLDEKLWGKTFRIRLTSKHSNKKIDFKIHFEHKHIEKK